MRVILNLLKKDYSIFQIIVASLSLPTIHALFFCLQLPKSLFAMVDVFLVSNIVFLFVLCTLLALFAMRTVPIICKLIYSMFITAGAVHYSNKHKKTRHSRPRGWTFNPFAINLLVFRKIKKNNLFFSLLGWFSFFIVYFYFYNGWSYLFIILLILSSSGIVFDNNISRFKEKYMLNYLKNNRILKLLDDDKHRSKFLFLTFIIIGLLVSSSGVARFNYLLNLEPTSVIVSDVEKKLSYIGSTSSGVFFFDKPDNKFIYISHDGNFIIKATGQ